MPITLLRAGTFYFMLYLHKRLTFLTLKLSEKLQFLLSQN